MKNTTLWKMLEAHIGNTIEIVRYGDDNGTVNISVEDMDTNEVIFDTDCYDLIGLDEDDDEDDDEDEDYEYVGSLETAKEYLTRPFVQEWLEKMQYTVKEDEYGHKFVFLAILCGYEKLDNRDFQNICNAVCWENFNSRLCMHMWIGGKVNWTMFYERPDHVNGHETFFCGVVSQDDFSPEDFDKDHSEYSFKNAKAHL